MSTASASFNVPSQSMQSQVFIPPLLLSPIESMFFRVEEQSVGAIRVAVVVRIDGSIDTALLAESLHQLQCRHPKLRAFITRGNDGRLRYEFNRLPPPIPLQVTEYQEAEPPWRETTRALLQSEFAPFGPLVLVAVLRSADRCRSELVMTMHHAIADGSSAIMLADDLLSEYARREEQSDAPPRPPLNAITVMRARFSGTWMDRFRVLQRAVRLHREERRSTQTTLPAAPDVPPQSQWIHWVFSQEETLRLIRRCRTENASISGALVAAVCLSLAENLPPGEALFKCQYPLNVREALGSPESGVTHQDLGCFVSVMNDFQRVSASLPFWELARRAQQSIEAFRKGGGPSLIYNLAAVLARPSVERVSLKALGTVQERVTLLATNYGVVNLRSSYGSLRVKACTLTPNNNGTGSSLVIESLVLGQQLNVGFAADQLDPALWAALQPAVRQQFHDAVS